MPLVVVLVVTADDRQHGVRVLAVGLRVEAEVSAQEPAGAVGADLDACGTARGGVADVGRYRAAAEVRVSLERVEDRGVERLIPRWRNGLAVEGGGASAGDDHLVGGRTVGRFT
ncbi:hypothetical protein [Streptomyces sp. NPDC006925]|uniref:hypothetical protein n=1 Tax=Streptomyces sp. NPDC006925 TaxID=3364768 RepID=UPI003674751D